MTRTSIGKPAAIALGKSDWWKTKTAREIAGFQLFTEELCCPFDVFHKSVEESLERSVWTHEFGLNYEGICKEFLGESEPPTMQEIFEMIPEEKRLIVVNPPASP